MNFLYNEICPRFCGLAHGKKVCGTIVSLVAAAHACTGKKREEGKKDNGKKVRKRMPAMLTKSTWWCLRIARGKKNKAPPPGAFSTPNDFSNVVDFVHA